jgi:hypothetical protein
VGSAGTVIPAPRHGATRPPGRVLLLSESAALAAVLSRLLGGDEQLTQLDSLRAATESGELANHDAVVVDVPRRGRGTILEHLRRHYHGPLVVLVEWGADASDLPADEAMTPLARPFAADQLCAALGLPPLKRPRADAPPDTETASARTAPAALAGKASALVAPPVGAGETVGLLDQAKVGLFEPDDVGLLLQDEERASGPLVEPEEAAAGGTGALPEPPRQRGWPAGLKHVGPRRRRVEVLLSELAHGWRTRRWVRVAGFSTVSVLAFVLAFALAASGGNDLVPPQVAPPPTYPLDLTDTPTTVRRAPTSTARPGVVPADGEFKGVSATTTTGIQATTTTRPAAGGATTRPPTTRPTTTTAGPTTTEPPGPTTTTIALKSTP